jgi:hypothetical protein
MISSPTYIPLFPTHGYKNTGPHVALSLTPYTLEMIYVERLDYEDSPGLRQYSGKKSSAPLGDLAFQALKSGVGYATHAADRVIRPEHILLGIVDVAQHLMSIVDPEHLLSIDRIRQLPPERGEDTYEITGTAARNLEISGVAAAVLWNAVGQAENHRALYVDAYHLLASLARAECAAGELLVRERFSANEIYDRLKESKIGELLRLTRVDEKPPYDPYRLTGRVISSARSKYRIVRFVNIGGMGAVYVGLRTPSDIDPSRLVLNDLIMHFPLHVHAVCLKFLKPDVITQHPLYGKAFEQEIEIVRNLIHPHIVRIADTGKTEEGLLYYVMEWVDGKSVEELVNESRLSAEETLMILKQVCSALDVAHQRKIIHLDIKPGNIMTSRRENGEINTKVIDFGLAKVASEVGLTTTLTQIGFTLQYCAPEVFAHKASPRSDVFSLGATLYVMLTGVVPFGTSYVFAKQQPAGGLPNLPSITTQCPDLPAAVDNVIARALQRKPRLRQSSALEFLAEYQAALAS